MQQKHLNKNNIQRKCFWIFFPLVDLFGVQRKTRGVRSEEISSKVFWIIKDGTDLCNTQTKFYFVLSGWATTIICKTVVIGYIFFDTFKNYCDSLKDTY